MVETGEWELYVAYPTATACTRDLDRREAEARRGAPFIDISKRAPTELSVMFRKNESGIFTEGITWQCLPDTVDPRK